MKGSQGMERARRIAQFWSWLPAFRAVAETEHLPSAAQQLGVSAQALSRTIKLLEGELDAVLFHRVGRSLQLSDAGRAFLASVRDAMRRVDDGLSGLEPGVLRGRLRIASRSTHAWVVIPAVAALARAHPEVMPILRTYNDDRIGAALRRGELDVALADRAPSQADLTVERLTEVTYGVYCGRDHPLHGVDTLEDRALRQHPFIGPPDGVDDQWPPEVTRRLGARVDLYLAGVALAETGAYLALLPDPEARAHGLYRLPVDLGVTMPLYLVSRRAVGPEGVSQVALQHLRAAVARRT
ncbi:MAG: LysR family transcriptional regulator [Myxococcota bacterium]